MTATIDQMHALHALLGPELGEAATLKLSAAPSMLPADFAARLRALDGDLTHERGLRAALRSLALEAAVGSPGVTFQSAPTTLAAQACAVRDALPYADDPAGAVLGGDAA